MSNVVKETNMHVQAIQDAYRHLKLTKREVTLAGLFALHSLLRSRVLDLVRQEDGTIILMPLQEPMIKEV